MTYSLENFFSDDYLNTKIILNPNLVPFVSFNTNFELDNYDYIKLDPEKLVNPLFQIPDYLSSSVKFWFDIYSKYDESTTLIHDKTHFDLVYNTISFTDLDFNNVGNVTKANLRKQIEKERFGEIKLAITHIFEGKKLTPFEIKIKDKILQANIIIPTNIKMGIQQKLALLKGLRRQSGLKNQINQGLEYYDIYYNTFKKYLELFDLPEEIMTIAFVESSFNIKAHSRAGAMGVWQFIKSTGHSFLKISENYDERKNIIISTLGAFHLLKQNFKIYKSWPLAISAYNSGHKHILKARRLNTDGDFNFQKFLDDYSHSDIKFASKNYFSEVLAMVFSIKYRKFFYSTTTAVNNNNFYLYGRHNYSNITKTCSDLGVERASFHLLNPQLPAKMSPSAYVTIVTDKMLDHKEYKAIDNKIVTLYFPKNFHKISTSKTAQ